MDPNSHSSSLNFELKLIRARNIHPKLSSSHFFVRWYLSAGGDKRVKLESQESKYDSLTWNQTFSLHCIGTQDSIKRIKQGTIVFELRRRTCSPSCLGRLKGSSKVVARGEMKWEDIVMSPHMEIEKWVVMIPKHGCKNDDVKPPAVQVTMKVEEQEHVEVMRREEVVCERWGVCDCRSCLDYEFFAIEAALEAL